ncbi:MAG: T9SS type A sorting domain-containing protein [Bacteroidales bacterium]|nr:T9SS type A sorting domain-containing protein [Bacteroidales bacterium]
MATGTLPIINISTENGVPVVDKETKIPALLNLSIPEAYTTLNQFESEDLKDVALTIKGRGNASWKLDKKPYKLKFEKKTSVLGMPKHKHYAIIPYTGWQSGPSAVGGMELARVTGQSWAPYGEPVEFILNGEYLGRYFIVESVKIDSNRLDIYEQEDLNEDPSLIPGGWLVEIDNYDDPCQITIPETEGLNLRVTYHTPEELSAAQEKWLINEFTAINAAIYSGDATGKSWSRYIDPASVARYFIVREILHDGDGYNGSFYLHKDLGDNCRWNFGPMWDLQLYSRKSDWIMEDHPSYSAVHWIKALAQTQAFADALADVWPAVKSDMQRVYDYVTRIGELCAASDAVNYERWPQFEKAEIKAYCANVNAIMKDNVEWIDQNLMYLGDPAGVSSVTDSSNVRFYGNTVEIGFGVGEASLSVYGVDGKCCRSLTLTAGDSVALSTLGIPAGMYIVRVSADSAAPAVRKIIIGK